MEVGWYLKIADKEVGPLSARQLKAMAGKGQISPFDPVRKGTDGSWVPAGNIKGLLPAGDSASDKPRPRAGGKQAVTPAATSSGAVQRKLPVAQAVALPVAQPVATPPPEAAPASPPPGGFHIDTGQGDPTARRAARGSAASPGRRKRRRNDAIIVVAVLVVVGLAAVAAGVALSRKGVGAASGSAGETQGREAPTRKREHEKVVIPGLDALLGESSPEGPGHADSKTPATDAWTDAPQSSGKRGSVAVKLAVEAKAEEEETETEKSVATSDERVAAEEPAMANEDDGGPISIPGVTDEPSMEDDEDDDFSFSDDPKLQKAREELRRQQAEKGRAGRSGNREK